ncbi:MAG: hypothetical protein IPI51_22465 [Betaproteobacteria bacterium]|nr:hypothetical protein [Betaproteobacteria bacterium]
MPIYKDQIERLRDRDLANCSFLGDPLLQAADILIYKARMLAGRKTTASGSRP